MPGLVLAAALPRCWAWAGPRAAACPPAPSIGCSPDAPVLLLAAAFAALLAVGGASGGCLPACTATLLGAASLICLLPFLVLHDEQLLLPSLWALCKHDLADGTSMVSVLSLGCKL